jgi:hypothetical protein
MSVSPFRTVQKILATLGDPYSRSDLTYFAPHV